MTEGLVRKDAKSIHGQPPVIIISWSFAGETLLPDCLEITADIEEAEVGARENEPGYKISCHGMA